MFLVPTPCAKTESHRDRRLIPKYALQGDGKLEGGLPEDVHRACWRDAGRPSLIEARYATADFRVVLVKLSMV